MARELRVGLGGDYEDPWDYIYRISGIGKAAQLWTMTA